MKKSVQDGLPKSYQFMRVDNLIYSRNALCFLAAIRKKGQATVALGSCQRLILYVQAEGRLGSGGIEGLPPARKCITISYCTHASSWMAV